MGKPPLPGRKKRFLCRPQAFILIQRNPLLPLERIWGVLFAAGGHSFHLQ